MREADALQAKPWRTSGSALPCLSSCFREIRRSTCFIFDQCKTEHDERTRSAHQTGRPVGINRSRVEPSPSSSALLCSALPAVCLFSALSHVARRRTGGGVGRGGPGFDAELRPGIGCRLHVESRLERFPNFTLRSEKEKKKKEQKTGVLYARAWLLDFQRKMCREQRLYIMGSKKIREE